MTVFTAAAVLALIISPTCGGVAPSSDLSVHLRAAVMTESGGDQYAIGINADKRRGLAADRLTATSAGEAIEKATKLLAQGRNIDLGLSQVNSSQLNGRNLSSMFDECANLRAGADHLDHDHAWVLAHRRYNCGRTDCGIAYAQNVTATVQRVATDVQAEPSPPPPDCPKPDGDGWHSPPIPPRCLDNDHPPTPEPEDANTDH